MEENATRVQVLTALAVADALPYVDVLDYGVGDEEKYGRAIAVLQMCGLLADSETVGGRYEVVNTAADVSLSSPLDTRLVTRDVSPIHRLVTVEINGVEYVPAPAGRPQDDSDDADDSNVVVFPATRQGGSGDVA